MKQLIVLISMILLGIAVAVVVLSFTETANTLSEEVKSNVLSTFSDDNIPAGN